MARVLILLSVILFSVYMTEQAYFLQKNFINGINEGASTWKAGVNFDPSTPLDSLVKLLGSKGLQDPNKLNSYMYKSHDSAYDRSFHRIPKYFDARKKWRQCKTIGKVLDQGNCGSCWAVATSSAFSDRLCIATDGVFNQLLSTEELTFCCYLCGLKCWGGFPIMAWMYFWRHGIVTGGEYNTTDGCAPYTVHPCPLNKDGNSTVCDTEPMESIYHSCPKKCYGNKDIEFALDHKYTRDFYYLTYAAIQKDIMAHGPIEATFEVYDDFFNYKSGVYVKSENATLLGGHAVKMIGWGEENGIPYWLCVNSWNEQWGDNGLFKIRRGTNECGIDNSTTAGVPVI